jgi:hypothetical protein
VEISYSMVCWPINTYGKFMTDRDRPPTMEEFACLLAL